MTHRLEGVDLELHLLLSSYHNDITTTPNVIQKGSAMLPTSFIPATSSARTTLTLPWSARDVRQERQRTKMVPVEGLQENVCPKSPEEVDEDKTYVPGDPLHPCVEKFKHAGIVHRSQEPECSVPIPASRLYAWSIMQRKRGGRNCRRASGLRKGSQQTKRRRKRCSKKHHSLWCDFDAASLKCSTPPSSSNARRIPLILR
jgi:hypothetical protein